VLIRVTRCVCFLMAAVAPIAKADRVIYSASNVSLSWTAVSGGFQDEMFSFLGPDVNLSGAASNFGGLLANSIVPGVPFSFGIPIINQDLGVAGAAGNIGGVQYTNLGVSSPDGVLAGLVFQPPQTTVSVPYALAGRVFVCKSPQFLGACPQDFEILFDTPGVLTVQLTPSGAGTWAVISGQFTTVPEPNTIMLSMALLAVPFVAGLRRSRRKSHSDNPKTILLAG